MILFEERLKILRDADHISYAAITGCPVDNALNSLHKIRYECRDIEPRLRHESRFWLENNGHDRFRGQPWPPHGILP